MNKRSLFYFQCLLILFLLLGCARVVQIEDSTTIDDAIILPTEPTIIEDGVTGGTFTSSDGYFSATVPLGSLPAGLRAQPTASETSINSNYLLENNETLISNAYELDLQAIDNFVATTPVKVSITFNSSGIDSSKIDSQYIYAKVYDPDTKATLPVRGTLSGSTLQLELTGLALKAVFSVVYDPSINTVLSGASGSSVLPFSTQSPPWQSNRWLLHYSSANPVIRSAVATIRGVPAASLTTAEIDATLKSRVADNAALAGTIYQTAGFRQPNLRLYNQAGTTESVYKMWLTAGGSHFTAGTTDENIAFLGYSYGNMYISPNHLTAAYTLNVIAHEMFHAIQSGYDIASAITTKGYKEGTATPYGQTIYELRADGEPKVRTLNNTEIMLLSNYLGCEKLGNTSSHYSNQDFFAYVGRAYNSNSLSYLADVFEQMKTDVDSLVAAGTSSARVAPPRETLRRAMNTAFTSKFAQSLPTIYFDFVRQRAMEHSTASQLRGGEPAAMTLNESLFHASAIKRKTVDPEDILTNPVEETFTNVAPFSSRVIIITPGRAVDDITAGLTISSTSGVLGSTLRAVLYRADEAGVELTGVKNLSDYGKTTDDVLTILVSNVGYSDNMNIKHKIGPPTENTLEATVVINGTNQPFSPKYFACGLGAFSGSITRSNLPVVSATERTGSAVLTGDLISILTDPTTISPQGGSYAINADDKVFVNSDGSATVLYSSAAITHADDGTVVAFESIGGSISFTSYGSSIGDYISGTFETQVAGSRETKTNPDEDVDSRETLLGTISGRFGMTLGSSSESSSLTPKIYSPLFSAD